MEDRVRKIKIPLTILHFFFPESYTLLSNLISELA